MKTTKTFYKVSSSERTFSSSSFDTLKEAKQFIIDEGNFRQDLTDKEKVKIFGEEQLKSNIKYRKNYASTLYISKITEISEEIDTEPKWKNRCKVTYGQYSYKVHTEYKK